MIQPVALHVQRPALPLHRRVQVPKHVSWRLGMDVRQIGTEIDFRSDLQFPDIVWNVRVLGNLWLEIRRNVSGGIAGMEALRVFRKTSAAGVSVRVQILER